MQINCSTDSDKKRFTNNFSLDEFIHSDIAIERGLDNHPSPNIIANLMQLAFFCEKVRENLGNKPMTITSGYRCEALNKIVGGVPKSAHLFGLACDFIAPTVGSPFTIYKLLRESGLPFDQLIYEFNDHRTWVHISIAAGNAQPRRQILSIVKEVP